MYRWEKCIWEDGSEHPFSSEYQPHQHEIGVPRAALHLHSATNAMVTSLVLPALRNNVMVMSFVLPALRPATPLQSHQ